MSTKLGWLVNDTLTCIPNTRTLWHDLLDLLPSLIDMTGGRTDFSQLPAKIEQAAEPLPPDYIIRNATFFRRLNVKTKTISLLQDICHGYTRDTQLDVINNSDIIVFNSKYTKSKYMAHVRSGSDTRVVPIGTDFEKFSPINITGNQTDLGILPNSLLFVGAGNEYPKGFDRIRKLIDTTNYNFCLVMKDRTRITHPRVRVFNSVNHDLLVRIYNSCIALLCTSREETLHLAGVEAAACNVPIITTNVGIYYDGSFNSPIKYTRWGAIVNGEADAVAAAITQVIGNKSLSPRDEFLTMGLDLKSSNMAWKGIVETVSR